MNTTTNPNRFAPPSVIVLPLHTNCALCGFTFTKPQKRVHCNSAAACAKRAARLPSAEQVAEFAAVVAEPAARAAREEAALDTARQANRRIADLIAAPAFKRPSLTPRVARTIASGCIACAALNENHGGVVTATKDGRLIHVSCRTGEFAEA